MYHAAELQTILRDSLSGHPWRDNIHVLDSTDSTNNTLRNLADMGAPHGTCLLSINQSKGRGRQGKSFLSLPGQGLYFSLLLRPHCIPSQTSHITLMAAVAACDAVEAVCGIRPTIKWPNDLVLGNKKLGGILTEMEARWEENTIEYIIVGIGINLNQRREDFPQELENIATSLRIHTRKETGLPALAAAMVTRFAQMSSSLITKKSLWLQRYRDNCVTLGKEVKIITGEQTRYAWALDINEEGGLMVRYPGGREETLSSGEVSVRGLWGYI